MDTRIQTKSVNPHNEHKLFYCSRVYFDTKVSSAHACQNKIKQKTYPETD